MEKRKIINSAVLLDSSSVRESEEGLRFTAVLKVFGRPNENGEIADPAAYDEFVKKYYEQGGYCLPLCYMHDERHIIGTVERMERDDERLTVQCLVFAAAPDYRYISSLVRSGVLGGVSDGSICYGYADDEGYHVQTAQMVEVSLVTVPAEIAANVMVTNTLTSGFSQPEDKNNRGGVETLFRPDLFV